MIYGQKQSIWTPPLLQFPPPRTWKRKIRIECHPAAIHNQRQPLRPVAGAGIAITAPTAYWDLNATSWANGVGGGDPLVINSGANLPVTATAIQGHALDNSATRTQFLAYPHGGGSWGTVIGTMSGVSFSAALWFQPKIALPNGSTTFDDVLTLSQAPGFGSGSSFIMRLNNATQWQAYYATVAGSGTDFTQVGSNITSPAPALNTWFFLMLRFNIGTGDIDYSINDGTKQTHNVGGSSIYTSTTQDLQVGSYTYLGGHIAQGYTDEVGWWKGHCLTDAEVTLLYNGGVGRTYNGSAFV